MLQEYFKNTLETTYIQAVLSAFNFPIIKTVGYGDYIFSYDSAQQQQLQQYNQYIYGNMVIKCTKTGFLGDFGEQSAEYTYVRDFQLNQHIFNVTRRNYISDCYYNQYTHRRFGDYLRCLRDVQGINLMGMYNCFAYEIFDDIYLTGDEYEYEYKKNKYVKVLAVPIRFNTKYTIAIDSISKVIIKPVFKGKDGYITEKILLEAQKLGINLPELDSKQFAFTKFFTPMVYELKTEHNVLNKYEDQLYLLVQVPATNTSSFVVLEGDYRGKDSVYVTGLPNNGSSYVESKDLSKMNTSCQLLKFNTGTTFAYDSELIQYLTNNVVSSTAQVPNNVLRVAIALKKEETDVWDNSLQRDVYKTQVSKCKYVDDRLRPIYRTKQELLQSYTQEELQTLLDNEMEIIPDERQFPVNTVYDMCGFVDRDAELLLNGGQKTQK